MKKQSLKDKDYVFTLLTSIVKNSGGEVKISEEDLCKVTKADVVTLMYNRNTKEIILNVNDPAVLQGLSALSDKDTSIN